MKNIWKAVFIITIAAFFWGQPSASFAEEIQVGTGYSHDIESDQIDPIHEIIKRQLKALREKDARVAYSLASEEIREKFNDPNGFLRMMKSSYGSIYNHLSYSFLDRIDADQKSIQKMELIGSDGVPIIAFYTMVKDHNGDWRIDGCMVLESNAQPI